MARMKFVCDSERCIECNGCVTACKNEHEVPVGREPPPRGHAQRRRARARSRSRWPACTAPTRPAWRCARSTASTAPKKAWCCTTRTSASAAATARYACPFGAPQFPSAGTFGVRGKMDKCTFCAGGPEANGCAGRVREVRPQPPGRRQAAGLRRDVLDQGAAGRRRRRGGRHLPQPRGASAARAPRSGAGARPTAPSRPASPAEPSHDARFALTAVAAAAGARRLRREAADRCSGVKSDAASFQGTGIASTRRPAGSPATRPAGSSSSRPARRTARTTTPRSTELVPQACMRRARRLLSLAPAWRGSPALQRAGAGQRQRGAGGRRCTPAPAGARASRRHPGPEHLRGQARRQRRPELHASRPTPSAPRCSPATTRRCGAQVGAGVDGLHQPAQEPGARSRQPDPALRAVPRLAPAPPPARPGARCATTGSFPTAARCS